MRQKWLWALLVASLLFPDLSNSCCCTWDNWDCKCNLFACNCATDEGYCYKYFKKCEGLDWIGLDDNVKIQTECRSSKGTSKEEYCPDRRRKRTLVLAISEAYGGLYSHLIERHAMENFLTFDVNRDGLISLEEAMESSFSNGTIDEFKQVDVNNDGYVHPSEFDLSLA